MGTQPDAASLRSGPPPVLSLRAVSLSYRAGVRGCMAQARILNAIELEVTDGEIVGVVGARRSGKTTLLRCAGGLLKPDLGVVELRGPLLLVDEPFVGDRSARRELHRAIEAARGTGMSILMASRHDDAVRRAASRVLVLE